jgi:hypothetical protein
LGKNVEVAESLYGSLDDTQQHRVGSGLNDVLKQPGHHWRWGMHLDEHSEKPDDTKHREQALKSTNADTCVIAAFDDRAWHCPFNTARRCSGLSARLYVSLIALPGFSVIDYDCATDKSGGATRNNALPIIN